MKNWLVIGAALAASAAIYGCGEDDNDDMASGGSASAGKGGSGSAGKGGSGSAGKAGGASGGEGGAATQSLCEKYGGADNVATVVRTNIIGAIAADCRISLHFTALDADTFTHVGDCLTIQVQELFGCSGVTYAGSMSSVDRACRSMTVAHDGLGISKGDFDALIEDVVAGLTEAGVEGADIMAAAPALLGMEPAIVEDEGSDPTKSQCAGGAGGNSGGGAGGN